MDAFLKAVAISGGAARYLSGLGHGYAVAGRSGEARRSLGQLHAMARQRYVSAYDFAVVCAGLGETESALVWLDKAYEERSTWLAMVNADSRFDALHSEPRFHDLLRRLGLAG